MRQPFAARLLQAHIREHDRYGGKPLWEAIVALCREMQIAGATVFHGVRSGPLPVVVTIVDTPEKIAALAPAIETMMDRGLLLIEDVQAVRLRRP